MKESSSAFIKFTKRVGTLADVVTSLAVCFQAYAVSHSILYGILAYPALIVAHAVFTYVFFMKELTSDKTKIDVAVEESQPYLAVLNAFICVLLHYA